MTARAHGDQALTYDLDITPDAAPANLEPLAAALRDMGGGLRVAGLEEPVPFDFDASSITRFTSMATRGRFGDLAVVVNPDGIPGGYAQLSANALREPAYGLTIAIADLDDLVAARHPASSHQPNRPAPSVRVRPTAPTNPSAKPTLPLRSPPARPIGLARRPGQPPDEATQAGEATSSPWWRTARTR